jgi:thiol-disulfide isomerase/thioredoxin
MACSEGHNDSGAVISGKLPYQNTDNLLLIPVENYFHGLKQIIPEAQYVSTTDSEGYFKFEIDSLEPGFYQLVHEDFGLSPYDIYLNEVDSLFIDLSMPDQKIRITGIGSDKFNYLENDLKVFEKFNEFLKAIRLNQFSNELEFKDHLDSLHLKRIEVLVKNEDISKTEKAHFINSINAEMTKYRLLHLSHQHFYKDGKIPDKAYFDFMDSLHFTEAFSKTTASKVLADLFSSFKTRQALQDIDEQDWWTESLAYQFNYISNLENSYWKDNLALGSILELEFLVDREDFFEDFNNFVDQMKGNFTNPVNERLFLENIKPFQQLAPGHKAPDFELPDATGKQHSISDYKGQVIYLDFWATWCVNCIEQIPAALKLQKYFQDQPVKFIYVALEETERDIDNWKKFISGEHKVTKKLTNNSAFAGLHLVAKGQFENEQIKDYQVIYTPTHVLIDQNGNIVNSRAKGPEEIYEEIEELLENPKQ